MKKNVFEFLINFLIGASWGAVFLGATLGLYYFHNLSIVSLILVVLLGMLPGLIFVVFFEIANIQIKKLEELKNQTKLLEKIASLMDK